MGGIRILLCTVPTREVAETLSQALVSKKLAACVNILPSLTSIYRWKGTVETEEELLLIVKTTEAQVAKTLEAIPLLHPYDVPEVIVLPIERGHPPYLAWVAESVETPD